MVSKMEGKNLSKTVGFLLFRVKIAWNIVCFAFWQSKTDVDGAQIQVLRAKGWNF